MNPPQQGLQLQPMHRALVGHPADRSSAPPDLPLICEGLRLEPPSTYQVVPIASQRRIKYHGAYCLLCVGWHTSPPLAGHLAGGAEHREVVRDALMMCAASNEVCGLPVPGKAEKKEARPRHGVR